MLSGLRFLFLSIQYRLACSRLAVAPFPDFPYYPTGIRLDFVDNAVSICSAAGPHSHGQSRQLKTVQQVADAPSLRQESGCAAG